MPRLRMFRLHSLYVANVLPSGVGGVAPRDASWKCARQRQRRVSMYSSGSIDPAYQIWLQDRLTNGLLLRRCIAWCIDVFVLGVLVVAFWMMGATFTVLTLGLGAPIFGLAMLLPLLYGFLSLVSLQASPGQAAMGLAVARDDDLGPPTALQALVYMIGYMITVAAGIIWCAVALVTTRHRTLHDMVAGLVVVRRSALETYLTRGPFA
jgi:uncharacterized RDD family membrane protein YckC